MWLRHTLQRNPVAVCENKDLSQLPSVKEIMDVSCYCMRGKGLSQLKQMNDNVLHLFTGQQ